MILIEINVIYGSLNLQYQIWIMRVRLGDLITTTITIALSRAEEALLWMVLDPGFY